MNYSSLMTTEYGNNAVLWRMLKSLATYVTLDRYVAKDWACAIDAPSPAFDNI